MQKPLEYSLNQLLDNTKEGFIYHKIEALQPSNYNLDGIASFLKIVPERGYRILKMGDEVINSLTNETLELYNLKLMFPEYLKDISLKSDIKKTIDLLTDEISKGNIDKEMVAYLKDNNLIHNYTNEILLSNLVLP